MKFESVRGPRAAWGGGRRMHARNSQSKEHCRRRTAFLVLTLKTKLNLRHLKVFKMLQVTSKCKFLFWTAFHFRIENSFRQVYRCALSDILGGRHNTLIPQLFSFWCVPINFFSRTEPLDKPPRHAISPANLPTKAAA